MGKQLTLFITDIIKSNESPATVEKLVRQEAVKLMDEGIKKSLAHADKVNDGWSDLAYGFLVKFIKGHRQFTNEEIRSASKGIVPEPPSNCAWGGVMVRAKRSGIIEKAGYVTSKNPARHCAPVSVWVVI